MIEIDPVVIEIQGVENGDLVVPVNNTLVCHTAFLATDTQPCVLMITFQRKNVLGFCRFLSWFTKLYVQFMLLTMLHNKPVV